MAVRVTFDPPQPRMPVGHYTEDGRKEGREGGREGGDGGSERSQ